MSKPLMCHVVAGYPTPGDCLQLLRGMQAKGVSAIEVQIPFSDPIADGETIMQANDVALANGMTTKSSFELIEKARQSGVDADLYLMSYLQKVHHFGLKKFCKQAGAAQVTGLIIPDLPYDSPEFKELRTLATQQHIDLVPVISPGMAQARLQNILKLKTPVLYVTSQQGITGNKYASTGQLKQLINIVRRSSSAKLMIGFGIRSPQDVTDALAIGDVAVVGSAVIKEIQAAGINSALQYIQTLEAA